MTKSLPPPPPRQPQRARGASRPKSRFHSSNDSGRSFKRTTWLKGVPTRDKRTRDLPNLSDCHGCGVHINFSNPEERLRQLKSFWRIVLLCRNCRKMVNSGHLCPYCLKDTLELDSDCVKCSDCERSIHQKCIVHYSASPPWSYSSSQESGLGFSRCVDCWVPNSLKNSVKVRRKTEITGKSGELPATQSDPSLPIKGKGGVKSLEEVVNNANAKMVNKVKLAVRKKERPLRKAVLAKNAMLFANNALALAAKENSSKKGEGLAESINNVSNVNKVPRFVGDAELAFQLHRSMNSSPRRSRNSCPTNLSCSNLSKMTSSDGTSPKLDDLGSGEDGKVAVCSDALTKDNNDSNIMEADALIRINECLSTITPLRLKTHLKTYERINKKKKDFQENENGYVGTSFEVSGKCTVGDDCKIVTEPQSCQSDECKQVSQVNEAGISSLESFYSKIFTGNWTGIRRPEHYAIKYKRISGCKMSSYKKVYRRHGGPNLDSISFQKEVHASSPGLPMNECGSLFGNSLHSCVNLQAGASIGVSSQEG